MENNQPTTELPPLGEPAAPTTPVTTPSAQVNVDAVPGEGVAVTDAIKQVVPVSNPAPRPDTSGEGKFNIVIALIVVSLIVAGVATFFLLTDQGRAILGLDKPVTNNQQSNNNNQNNQQSQTATEVNGIVDDIEDDLEQIDADESFDEFDEEAEFGVGI